MPRRPKTHVRPDRRRFVAGALASLTPLPTAAAPRPAQDLPGVPGAVRAARVLRSMEGRGTGPIEVWFLPGCRWSAALAFAVMSHGVPGMRWVPGGGDARSIRRCLEAPDAYAFLQAVRTGGGRVDGPTDDVHPNVAASRDFEVEAWRTVGLTAGSPTLVYPAGGEWRMVRGTPDMDDLSALVRAATGR